MPTIPPQIPANPHQPSLSGLTPRGSSVYAAADKMPEAKAALAEAMNLNPKLSVAWFHAHNSSFVDAPPGFRESLIKAGLPKE